MVKLGSTLESSRKDKRLANSDNIYDKKLGKMQEKINQEVSSLSPVDEEDLTRSYNDNGRSVTKFADRSYSPQNFSGKGYKILRKNIKPVTLAVTKIVVSSVPTSDGYLAFIINGVESHVDVVASSDTTTDKVAEKIAAKLSATMTEYEVSKDTSTITLTRKFGGIVSTPSSFSAVGTGVSCNVKDSTKIELRNILTPIMMNQPNTIYEIRYDFDLNGETIEVQEGCTLKFNGGKLRNTSLILHSNVSIIGDDKSVIEINPNKSALFCENEENIEISRLKFDFTKNQHKSFDFSGIVFKHCSEIFFHNNYLIGEEKGKSGFNGLYMFVCKNILIKNNIFKYFFQEGFWTSNQAHTAWATYFVSIEDAIISGNIIEKSYSGIKLTGFIKNVLIENNNVYNSITDGCDFAGISVDGLSINANNFYGCHDCGVECKILKYNSMHYGEFEKYYGYSEEVPRTFKNISIFGNTLYSHTGIRLFNFYSTYKNIKEEYQFLSYDGNITNNRIESNVISSSVDDFSDNKNSKCGIQISCCSTEYDKFIIKDNNLQNHKFGIYLVNSSNLHIALNNVYAITCSYYSRLEPDEELSCERIENITLFGNFLNAKYTNDISLKEYEHNFIIQKNIVRDDTIVLPNITDSNGDSEIKDNIITSLFTNLKILNGEYDYFKTLGVSSERKSPKNINAYFFNIERNENEKCVSLGEPFVIQYRITKIPTAKGNLNLKFVTDTAFAGSVSITIPINYIPENVVDFCKQIVANFPTQELFYVRIAKNNILQIVSKINYTYSTPPAPTYETETGAEFLSSYINGSADIWEVTTPHIGSQEQRPTNVEIGFIYNDTTLNKLILWNGNTWVNLDGSSLSIKKSGTTSERPTNVDVGFIYNDTTLNKLILWNGNTWVNLDGSQLS